jgi:hypothetical protein
MGLKALSTMSLLALLAVTAGACGSDGKSSSSSSALEKKCATMCERLVAPPLSGCGKSDGSDLATCKSECFEHVTPKSADEPPEASEDDLDCAIGASSCDVWTECGDLL